SLDYSKLSQHPRLILKKGDIEAVKQKIETDEPLRIIHNIIERRANEFIPAAPTRYRMVGKRLLGRCRAVLERVCYCSYMYLVSGDELYARRAEKEMLAAANFVSWNPSHFLDVGEMTTALAIGYDWLYDWLSPESKKIIEDAIIEKGLRASDNKRWWSRSHNNWNQVCNGGLVMGALAVYERVPEEAQRVIAEALQGNPKAQQAYGPDGVYPEGFGYWEYGTWYEVMLIEALRTALGTSCDLEKAPGFLESAKFMNFMVAPTGTTYNFSDCGNPSNMVNPLLYWFALETGDMSLVWQDRLKITSDEQFRGINRQAPIAMLFASRCDTKEIQPIKEKFWYGHGIQPLFLYRSGFGSKEDSYLAAKGGSPMNSHAHMDSGSFIYEWGGVRWAVELGSQDYHSLESKGIGIWKKGQNSQRWQVYRLGNYSHNTLTINERLHQYKGKAPMTKVINKKKVHGAEFDLSSSFVDVSSVRRTIYIDNNDKVTCIDKLENYNVESNVRWNMTTFARAEIIDDHTISLKQDGKEVILRVVSPKSAKAYIMKNNSDNWYDVKNKGVRVGFNIEIAPSSKCTLKVELVPQK
ncbi:MAG: heparinase II/III family protein, partial [Alistipes sp.]|nr:heparinase II/III family protein [Alistipes sp.]